jgi:hypothetical protein
MNTEEDFDRVISNMQAAQRVRESAWDLYAALAFCKTHLEEENWASEEARLESLDMTLSLCDVVFRRCIGERDEH